MTAAGRPGRHRFYGSRGSHLRIQRGRRPCLIFAQLTQTDGSFLMGREEEPDFKWENLREKTIIGGQGWCAK